MKDLLAQHNASAVAILDADREIAISYAQLLDGVGAVAEHLSRHLNRGLVFLLASNTVDAIVIYLACLASRCPVVLLDPGLTKERLEALVKAYRPDAVVMPAAQSMPADVDCSESLPNERYRLGLMRRADGAERWHTNLTLLLTTSGSTGSPKLVRLTLDNLLANARAIASYLGIEPGERCIQSLPMHYSYGLSLVNSHLAAGATVVLTAHSFLRPEFWHAFDSGRCTSFAGVPYVYETLHRLRFDPARHPSLRTMTQAGGALRGDLIQSFHDRTRAARCRFFVMYGQTEATARISYVPADRLGGKIGSIGIPIPGGELSLAPLESSDQHELIYRGPNVMMGYAQESADLASGDLLGGTLRTGDLARVDSEGYFYLTGRLSRFAKLFGSRVNLEDVETEVESRFRIRAAATEGVGQLVVHAAAAPGDINEAEIVRYLAGWLGVPPQFVKLRAVTEIPMTASGKKDYRALQA